MLKRLLNRIGPAVVILGLAPVLVIGVVLAALMLRESADINRLAVQWFVVSFAMLATMAALFVVTVTAQDRTVDAVREQLQSLGAILDERLSPDIRVLNSIDQVRVEAARMLELAIKQEDKRPVIYYGAANLAPTKEEERRAEEELLEQRPEEERKLPPAMRFKYAFDSVLSPDSGVELIRYIRLFTESELQARSKEFTNSHLQWMRGQINLLKSYENYKISIAARAPEWGGTLSICVAANTVLLMIGQGSSAVWVRGFEIAKEITEHAYKFMYQASEKNRPHQFSKATAEELEKLLARQYGKLWITEPVRML